MTAPIDRRLARWVIDHIFWDSTGTAREGFLPGLWATRKLLIAIAVAAVLTWLEWEKNHPPEIALIAIMHFVVVCAAIALAVRAGQWFSRGD